MFIDDLDHQEKVHVERLLAKIGNIQARQDFREFSLTVEVLKALVHKEKLNERKKMALIELLIG